MQVIKTLAVSLLGASSFMAMMAVTAVPASAQATRTWVSGVGDDVNPCSRTAPCKTFAGAISKTATNGEINCLDPGGFGGLTITKGISVVCHYTEGGVLTAGAGVNGFVVNAPAASHVYLRGLDFHGAGSAQNGLRIIAGASVTLEDSVIRAYNATNGFGISFQPSGATNLTLNNVTIDNNGNGATGGGVLIQPTGVGGSGKVTLNDVRVTNNANQGVKIDTGGNTGIGVFVSMQDTTISGTGAALVANQPVGTASIRGLIIGSRLANNTNFGINASGASVNFRVGGTTITNSGTAVGLFAGALVHSYGNNFVDLNATTDGTFTAPDIPTT